MGQPTGEEGLEMGGSEGLLRAYATEDGEWVTLAAATIRRSATYWVASVSRPNRAEC